MVGQGDAFPLSLPNKRALELGEGSHDRKHEVGLGGAKVPSAALIRLAAVVMQTALVRTFVGNGSLG
jgi:hypothetical protein